MSDFAVDVEKLTFRYGDRIALNELSFHVMAGEIFGLLGPNGGGKTTLFRILSTGMLPQFGRARVFGYNVADDPQEVRSLIGVVFQSPSLDRKLTVSENLMHQGHLYGLSGRVLRERISESLEAVHLSARAFDRVEKLSGGMQRRAEVAKSLLHRPKLLLMDEPSTGLDPGARRDLGTHLAGLASQGVTIVLTTHLMDEAEMCGRLAIVDEGKVVLTGTPEELKKSVAGDVLTISSRDPEQLRTQIAKRLGSLPGIVDGDVRLEVADFIDTTGGELVAKVSGMFPELVDSIRLGRPTLADVFIHATGRAFDRN
jgi:ABC-2 type transport system ATP-binding protein